MCVTHVGAPWRAFGRSPVLTFRPGLPPAELATAAGSAAANVRP